MSKVKKFKSLQVLITLLILSLFSAASLSTAQSAQKPKKEMRALEKLLKRLQVELKVERAKRSAQERALQNQEQNIALLGAQITRIDKKLTGLQSNLKRFKKDKTIIQQKMAALDKSLNFLIKQRYQMGDRTPLKLLINQQNPEHVSRMLFYFEKINQHLNTQIVSYRNFLIDKQVNSSQIDSTQRQLMDERQLLAKQQQTLQSARQTRRRNLQVIDTKIANNRTKIKSLSEDKKRLDRVLSRIKIAIAKDKRTAIKRAVLANVQKKVIKAVDNRPFKSLKGKLPWPVSGNIGRKFGSFENNLAYDGVFIKAKQGAPIKAVHTGKVVFSDWLRSYGMVLIVDHGFGYLTLYGHNDQLNKKVGSKVFAGDVIARVGSSGGNQRPGLYFAVRRNGQTTNPVSWLRAR